MEKLCEDCKWCKYPKCKYAECRHPKGNKWVFCSIHREDGWITSIMLRSCGKRGRWFEEKRKFFRVSSYYRTINGKKTLVRGHIRMIK